MMDEGKIALSVGVELSYLNDTMQREILETCQSLDCTPSYSQSCELRKYEDFPQAFKDYIAYIEAETKCRISIVSVGPDRDATVIR